MKEGNTMNALFIILNDTSAMDDVIRKLIELGVGGATILDSQGMASAIVHGDIQVPLFGSLKNLLSGEYPYSKTIFTVIDNEPLLEQTVVAVKRIVADLRRAGAGFMFTVPVGHVYKLGIPEKK
jgi:nitrogen regulatory protein P-II 1